MVRGSLVVVLAGMLAAAPVLAAPAQPRVALVQDEEAPVDKAQDLTNAESNVQGKMATYFATFGFGCGFCCGCTCIPPGCMLPVAALFSTTAGLQVVIILAGLGLGLMALGLVLMGVNAAGYLTTIFILNRMGLFDSMTAVQAMQDVFNIFSILWSCL